MTKKIVACLVAVSFLIAAKSFAEDKAPKGAAAKQPKVVETRINEGDLGRLEVAVGRAVKEAVIAKQGPSGFEYMAKRMKPPKNEKWQDRWNELGAEGWEAVDHFENVYIFKRAAIGVASSTIPRVKPAESPAKAEPVAVPVDDKAAKKAEKEVAKAAKEQAKADEKAAKDTEKAAKKADKAKQKELKKAQKEAEKAAKEKEKAAKKQGK